MPKEYGQLFKDGGGSLNVVATIQAGDELSYAQDGTFKGYNVITNIYLEPRGPDDKAYDFDAIANAPIYEKLVAHEKGNK